MTEKMTEIEVEQAYESFLGLVQMVQNKCMGEGTIKSYVAKIGTPGNPTVLKKKDFKKGGYYLVNYTLNPQQHPQYHLLRIDKKVEGKGKKSTQYECADITGFDQGVQTAGDIKMLIPLKIPKNYLGVGEQTVSSAGKSLVATLNIPEEIGNREGRSTETEHERALREATILLQELKDFTAPAAVASFSGPPPAYSDLASAQGPVSAQEPAPASTPAPKDPNKEMKQFLQSIEDKLVYFNYYVPMISAGYNMDKLKIDEPVEIMRTIAKVEPQDHVGKTILLQKLYMLNDTDWNYGEIGEWLDKQELGDYKAAVHLAGYTEVDDLLDTEEVKPAEFAREIVGDANDADRGKLQALVEELQKSSATAAQEPESSVWEVKTDDGWKVMGADVQKQLITAKAQGVDKVEYSARSFKYVVNLKNMTQVNLTMGTVRNIRKLTRARNPAEPEPEPAPEPHISINVWVNTFENLTPQDKLIVTKVIMSYGIKTYEDMMNSIYHDQIIKKLEEYKLDNPAAKDTSILEIRRSWVGGGGRTKRKNRKNRKNRTNRRRNKRSKRRKTQRRTRRSNKRRRKSQRKRKTHGRRSRRIRRTRRSRS